MDFSCALIARFDRSDDATVRGLMTEVLSSLQAAPANRQEAWEKAQALFALAQFEAALAVLAEVNEDADVSGLRQACYYHLAHSALETGDLVRAERAVEKLVREAENDFRAWAVRGEIASLRGDEVRALESFNRALNALPRDYNLVGEQADDVARLLYLRVASLVRLRRFAEALEHWRPAVERASANADLWYLGALAVAQLGRAEEALRYCQQALTLDALHLDANKLKRQLSRPA